MAQQSAPAARRAPPAVGTVENGYRYKGGDPAQQSSWEQAAPIPAPEYGNGAQRLPNGAVVRYGPRGGMETLVSATAAKEAAGEDDVDLRAAAELRGRLVLSLGGVGEAQQRLEQIVDDGYTYNDDWGARLVEGVSPTAARILGGDDYQRLETASRSFESAMLPVFSGAAVTDSEARRFIGANLPALGDSAETLATKERNRALMLNGAAVLLGQDIPYPELGVFGGLFKRGDAEVSVDAVMPDVERIGLNIGPGGAAVGPAAGGPAPAAPGGQNVGTGFAPAETRIGLTSAGRPIGQNGLPVVSGATRAVADSVFDSAEIVERDGQPFYAVGLQPGQGAPADLQTRYGADGEISAEEMRAAGYVPDEQTGRWLFPIQQDRLQSNDGLAAGPRPGSGGSVPFGDTVAPGGIEGLIAASGRPGSDPTFHRQIEEDRQRDRNALPLPLRVLANGYRDFEAFAQAATEQIPGLDEAAAWTAARLSGEDYADARAMQADMIAYDNENYRPARVTGGVAGAGATVLTPLGAPLRVTRGATLGGRVLNRAAGGAAGGATYGFAADDGNVLERFDGAVGGAALGAPAGVAAPWIAGRANAFGEVLSDGARVLGRNVGGLAADHGVPGAQRLVAASAPRTSALERGLEKFAQRSPQQSEAMLGNVNALSGETITPTFADAVNDGGRGLLRAMATRQTPARQAAREFADGRAADIQDRIAGQARRLISDDVRSPDLIREQALREAQDAARPLYAAAYDRQIEITPTIEDLLSRPAGRKALERARAIAANEGRNPDDLRLVPVEDWGLPTGGGSALPRQPVDPTIAADLRAVRDNVGTRRAGRGKTLMQFVAENGGIRDEWGELTAIGTDGWSRAAPWRRQILQENGVDLETMAQRAVEAGYFDDLAQPTMDGAENMSLVGRDALLQAFDREMAGTPRFARDAAPADAMRASRRGELEERLGREGLDPRRTSPAEARAAFQNADEFEARATAHLEGDPLGAPPVDIVRDTGPNMETLDYLKRGLDDVLESYRDPVTNQMRLDDEGRAIERLRQQFRGELVRINPTYGDALAAYEGPIRLQRAADIGEGFMAMEADEFGAGIDSLRGSRELAVARSAARRAIERAAGTQGAAPGVAARLSSGREQGARLAALVGPRRGAEVQRAMGAELQALRNARAVNPMEGSATNRNQQDSLTATGELAGWAMDLGTGNGPGLIRRTINGLRNRMDFNDAQAEAVVTAAIDPSQTQRMLAVLSDRMTPREFRNLSRAIRHQINRTLQPSQPEAPAR